MYIYREPPTARESPKLQKSDNDIPSLVIDNNSRSDIDDVISKNEDEIETLLAKEKLEVFLKKIPI